MGEESDAALVLLDLLAYTVELLLDEQRVRELAGPAQVLQQAQLCVLQVANAGLRVDELLGHILGRHLALQHLAEAADLLHRAIESGIGYSNAHGGRHNAET